MKLSYLDLMTTDPSYNLAMEQYVFDCLPRDRMYFMLWQNDNAIIVGKYQNTISEINEEAVRERGIRVVLGNAANEEIMNLAHLDCARWLLLTIPNGYEAGEIVASAREKCPSIEIIARAHYDDEVEYITERGANQVVMGEREIARTMLELIETPPAGEVATAS